MLHPVPVKDNHVDFVDIYYGSAGNSKYFHTSVINYFRQLNRESPIFGGTIHTNPFVNSNAHNNGFCGNNVSNACPHIDNMEC